MKEKVKKFQGNFL